MVLLFEEDPHSGDIKDNQIQYEIPLLLAGGAYLASIFPLGSIFRGIQNAVSIAGIAGILYTKKGAIIGDVMGFISELPSIIYLVIKKTAGGKGGLSTALGYLYALLFLARVGGLGYTVYQVAFNDNVDIIMQILAILFFISSLGSVLEVLAVLSGNTGCRRSRRSSRSRSRSRGRRRSRSRSRSRSCKPKRC